MTTHPQTVNTPIVVVLVHGTFQPDAAWTMDGSNFRKYVSGSLDNVLFETVTWGGRNSHEERINGGRALRERLGILRARYPESALFVVAHSHGGNVALYAAHDAECAKSLSGIVTLCTPFLSFRPRSVPRSLSAIIGEGFALLATGLAISISALLSKRLYVAAMGLVPLLSLVAYVWLGQSRFPKATYHRIRRWVAKKQNDFVSFAPPPTNCKIFNLQMSFDEARLWLNALSLAAQCSVAMIPLMTLVALVIGTAVLALFVLPVVIVFVTALCMLIRGHTLGFGRERGWTHFLVDIRAHAEPPTSHPILQDISRSADAPFAPHRWPLEYLLPKDRRHWLLLPSTESAASSPAVNSLRIASVKGSHRFSSLRHSRLYNSPDVAEAVVNWLARRASESMQPRVPSQFPAAQ